MKQLNCWKYLSLVSTTLWIDEDCKKALATKVKKNVEMRLSSNKNRKTLSSVRLLDNMGYYFANSPQIGIISTLAELVSYSYHNPSSQYQERKQLWQTQATTYSTRSGLWTRIFGAMDNGEFNKRARWKTNCCWIYNDERSTQTKFLGKRGGGA